MVLGHWADTSNEEAGTFGGEILEKLHLALEQYLKGEKRPVDLWQALVDTRVAADLKNARSRALQRHRAWVLTRAHHSHLAPKQ